jgi:hypothetical protein
MYIYISAGEGVHGRQREVDETKIDTYVYISPLVQGTQREVDETKIDIYVYISPLVQGRQQEVDETKSIFAREVRSWGRDRDLDVETATAASSGDGAVGRPTEKFAKCPSCVGRGPIWVAHFVWENRPTRATPILNRSPPDGNGQVNLCTQNLCPGGVGGYM